MDKKNCISCGMPLVNKEDFPNDDISKKYCIYCAKEDGSMKSFEEAIEGMANFLMDTQNVTIEEAKIKAKKYLLTQEAWSDFK